MYQLPQTIWNQIAKYAQTPEMKAAFSIPEEKQIQFLDNWDKLETEAGNSEYQILMVFPLMLPSLVEGEAISNFLRENPEMEGIRQAIPEVSSPEEAVEIAGRDMTISPQMRARIIQLLKDTPTRLKMIMEAAQLTR